MKFRHSISVTAAALGVVAGAVVPGSSIAQAAVRPQTPQVLSVWVCGTFYNAHTSNVEGLNCYGSGSGSGWFYYSPQDQEGLCRNFTSTPSIYPYYTVYGSGCTPNVGPVLRGQLFKP